ncbi:LPD7 domain-containing protein [Psychrobacter sp. TWP2-1-2]|uniref:LPD7 domain-containing protein n=1 Tax=Psychrobacter sp. TWP2-1-2 TaxID=2804623 RepID=UPI003CF1B2AF
MATDKNAKAIHGEVVDFGSAPYKNDPTNNASFYVTLNQNGDDKTFWGNGLQGAIKQADIQKGDTATFVDRGVEQVSVPDKDGNFVQAKKRYWDAEKYEPPLNLQNTIEVDNAPTMSAEVEAEIEADTETSIKLSKGDLVKVDADKNKNIGLPQSLENNYIAIAKNRFLKEAKIHFYDKTDPKTVAFEDRTTALATSKNDEKTVKAMLDLAQSKNWKAIQIKGDPEFKKQMWIESRIRGIETKGFKPTEADRAELLAIQEGRTKNTVTNDYARSKEIEKQEAQAAKEIDVPEVKNDSVEQAVTASTAVEAEKNININGEKEKELAVDNDVDADSDMTNEQRQVLLDQLYANEAYKKAMVALDLATKDLPNQAWLNEAAIKKFETTLIEMDEFSENTGKSFTENQVVDFAKSDLNEVGQSLNDADRMAVLGRFDDEVNADKQAVIDNSVAEKFNNQFDRYEALHKDLDAHRNARNQVDNYNYGHNHTAPDPDVYEKSTPEVREAVIANLAENMTADAKQVLTENNIDKEQVERIAEFIETDIRDRAAIDADSAKVASPMSDYVQAANAHIIRGLGSEKGIEIANINSEKMLGDKASVEPLTADKHGRYGEIVSETLRDRNIDNLTVSKAQAVIYDPNEKDVKPQQSFERYQQQIGEQLYKSGYSKDSIAIMNEVSDKYHGIERNTPEFLESKLGGTDKKQDNSLSIEKDKNDDKGFKEVKVVEDVKIGDADRSRKIATDKMEDKAVAIEAVKKLVHELYKDDPKKLGSCLKTIDEKTPDIMAGKIEVPQMVVNKEPQVEFKAQPTQQSNIDRGR